MSQWKLRQPRYFQRYQAEYRRKRHRWANEKVLDEYVRSFPWEFGLQKVFDSIPLGARPEVGQIASAITRALGTPRWGPRLAGITLPYANIRLRGRIEFGSFLFPYTPDASAETESGDLVDVEYEVYSAKAIGQVETYKTLAETYGLTSSIWVIALNGSKTPIPARTYIVDKKHYLTFVQRSSR